MPPPTVTVACKLPNGLHLRLFEFHEENVPILGGGFRLEKRSRQIGESVTVFGNAKAFNAEPKSRVVAGYALTENVSAEFWDEWLKQNADADVVKNRIVFAYERPGETEHEAKEHKTARSGLEPMDMRMIQKGDRRIAADPRVPRQLPGGGGPAVTIEDADTR